MSYIVVCPLENVSQIAEEHGCKEMISLMSPGHDFNRPSSISADNHLHVGMNDINFNTQGLIPPDEAHVASILEFAKKWDQNHPLLVHCWFGVSRSPATAILCSMAVDPDQSEQELAEKVRAASPSATPNRKIIEIGDALLNCGGKLSQAVNSIGRGREASQGSPFILVI